MPNAYCLLPQKMNYKENYKNLITHLESLGGNIQSLRGVSRLYSIENELKVKKEIQRLSGKNTAIKEINTKEQVVPQSKEITHLIVDFPPELHPVYLAKKQTFLQVCSLKTLLNQVPIASESEALALQRQIFDLFEKMDDCDHILDHWKKHKRILVQEKTNDFSHLTAVELVQRRNTLRSNITAREKTLKKWEKQLENKENFTLQEKIVKKTEELIQLKLTVKKLDELIK